MLIIIFVVFIMYLFLIIILKMDEDLWFTQTREIINVRKYIFSFL